jgi:hypothetical protein
MSQPARPVLQCQKTRAGTVTAYVVGTQRPRWTLGRNDVGHASVDVIDCIASRTRQPSRDGPSALRTGAFRLRGADGGSDIR